MENADSEEALQGPGLKDRLSNVFAKRKDIIGTPVPDSGSPSQDASSEETIVEVADSEGALQGLEQMNGLPPLYANRLSQNICFERWDVTLPFCESSRSWVEAKLQTRQAYLKWLQEAFDHYKLCHTIPELALNPSITASELLLSRCKSAVIELWQADGPHTYPSWRHKLDERRSALIKRGRDLLVACPVADEKLSDPVLFLVVMRVFFPFIACSVCCLHGLLVLSLLNENTALK